MQKQDRSKGFSINRVFSTYNLPIILVLTFGFFSLILPTSFPTWFNIKSILNNQSTIILLALAVMVTIATNNYNLSVGYHIGLAHILVVGLQIKNGWSWQMSILFVLLVGVVIGIVNGFFVAVVGVSDFITTLGTGNIIYGIAFWYTGGRQIIGPLPKEFTRIATNIYGIPSTFIIAVVIGILMHIMMEYFPIGRFFYFLGANRKAADLTGISATKYIIIAFILSGLITSLAGVLLGAMLRVGQTTVGPGYLMNANAGALLGSVAFKIGKVNVWGSFCAVLVLAVIVAGLLQLGAAYWVEPVFNGGTLIIAVALALTAARNKATKIRKEKNLLIRASREK